MRVISFFLKHNDDDEVAAACGLRLGGRPTYCHGNMDVGGIIMKTNGCF